MLSKKVIMIGDRHYRVRPYGEKLDYGYAYHREGWNLVLPFQGVLNNKKSVPGPGIWIFKEEPYIVVPDLTDFKNYHVNRVIDIDKRYVTNPDGVAMEHIKNITVEDIFSEGIDNIESQDTELGVGADDVFHVPIKADDDIMMRAMKFMINSKKKPFNAWSDGFGSNSDRNNMRGRLSRDNTMTPNMALRLSDVTGTDIGVFIMDRDNTTTPMGPPNKIYYSTTGPKIDPSKVEFVQITASSSPEPNKNNKRSYEEEE